MVKVGVEAEVKVKVKVKVKVEVKVETEAEFKIIKICLQQFQNELKGTSRRRAQPTTGRGGAPKFFLNWLTFAL